MRTIKDVINDNKKEILIFGGSALMLGVGVACLLKSTKLNWEIMKYRGDKPLGMFKADELKDKAIEGIFATVEYVDGEIGIIEIPLNEPSMFEKLFEKAFPTCIFEIIGD